MMGNGDSNETEAQRRLRIADVDKDQRPEWVSISDQASKPIADQAPKSILELPSKSSSNETPKSPIAISSRCPKSPRSLCNNPSKSPVSISHFDENRNKSCTRSNDCNNGGQKTTRFSSLNRKGPAKHSSPGPVRGRSIRGRSLAELRPCKREPTGLTRKSADWGTNSKGQGQVGFRRTEVMIVLMGSSKVGKSAIVNQFLHNIFCHDYAATVDELHWIEYDATNFNNPDEQADHNAPNGTLLLKIMDASGSHEFIGMRKLYEQQGDAFIIVISIDDRSSFEEAKVIRQEINERNAKKAPIICVLNKIDMKHGALSNAVKVEEVRDFASDNQCLFVEVTAKEHESVEEIFKRLLQQNSAVPSAAQLKYRRKSMPITIGGDFPSGRANMKNVISHKGLFSSTKYLKAMNASKFEDNEKQSACTIC